VHSGTATLASLAALLLAACADVPNVDGHDTTRGRLIYAKECAPCHGVNADGAGPLATGVNSAVPDLVGLSARNDGYFPREFVRRFVLGVLERDDPEAAMPDFSKVGLSHVYRDGTADGDAPEADLGALLDYLESTQS